MSKQTDAFFAQLKAGEHPPLAESIRQAASVLKDVGGQLWDGGKPMFDHGRTELAAALFSGNAHVMYMRESREFEQHSELPDTQRSQQGGCSR